MITGQIIEVKRGGFKGCHGHITDQCKRTGAIIFFR